MKTAAAWVPWTFDRLAAESGYGAGIESPGWYAHLWSGAEPLAVSWMARVGGALPRGGHGRFRRAPGRGGPPGRDARRDARPRRAIPVRAERGRPRLPRDGFGSAAQARARPPDRRPGHGRDAARCPGRAARRRPGAADPPAAHEAGARPEDDRPRPPKRDGPRPEPPAAPTRDPRHPLGPDPAGLRQERDLPRGLGPRLAARVRDRSRRRQPLRQHDRGSGLELVDRSRQRRGGTARADLADRGRAPRRPPEGHRARGRPDRRRGRGRSGRSGTDGCAPAAGARPALRQRPRDGRDRRLDRRRRPRGADLHRPGQRGRFARRRCGCRLCAPDRRRARRHRAARRCRGPSRVARGAATPDRPGGPARPRGGAGDAPAPRRRRHRQQRRNTPDAARAVAGRRAGRSERAGSRASCATAARSCSTTRTCSTPSTAGSRTCHRRPSTTSCRCCAGRSRPSASRSAGRSANGSSPGDATAAQPTTAGIDEARADLVMPILARILGVDGGGE